jgi:hypothetical protein
MLHKTYKIFTLLWLAAQCKKLYDNSQVHEPCPQCSTVNPSDPTNQKKKKRFYRIMVVTIKIGRRHKKNESYTLINSC